MYKVSWEVEGLKQEVEHSSLDLAMEHAKKLNLFVHITSNQSEFTLVGKFGVDSIQDGICPDGVEYSWRKRRP